MAHAVIVFSGFNFRAVICFCRYATQTRIPFHVVARDEQDPIFLTDYASDVVFTRSNLGLVTEEFVRILNDIRDRFAYDYVIPLPTTEYLNRFLVENKNEIDATGNLVPLVSASLYEQLSNKSEFAELCSAHGICTPACSNQLPGEFPFVAKPIAYAGSDGRQLKPQLIFNEADLDQFLLSFTANDFAFQEYVTGHSIYLLYYVTREARKGGTDVLYSQQNLIQQQNGGSMILARPHTLHETALAQDYLQLFRNLGFWGLVMVEVRGDVDGELKMIEANPRPWGPMQLAVDWYPDFWGEYLRELGFEFEIADADRRPSDYYFWSGGFSPSQQPIIFHDFTPDEFVNDFPRIRRSDLFARPDTWRLYLNEQSTP